MVLLGGLLFVLGAARFVLRHRFSFIDALHCCLAVIPAGLFLLVVAYVVQHARLASIIPLCAGGLLAITSPMVDISLGLALMGAVAGPALSEWKSAKRLVENAGTDGAFPGCDEHKNG